MSNQRKLQLGVVNITIHPHTANDYVDLLNLSAKVGAVQIRGTTYAELKHPEFVDDFLYAEIYKYTDIDKSSSWYNKSSEKLATPEEVDAIAIPDNLAPNAGKFSVYFYPRKHLIFYQSYYQNQKLSPNQVVTVFENLFSHHKIKSKYGIVNVTHVPEKKKVEELISNTQKETLQFELTRPNPDSLEEVEREIMERMNNRNVAVHRQEYKSIDNTFIEMDEDMKTLARVAAKNGKVTSRVKESNGAKTILSTQAFPFTVTEYFDDKIIGEIDMFKKVVNNLLSRVSEWLN